MTISHSALLFWAILYMAAQKVSIQQIISKS